MIDRNSEPVTTSWDDDDDPSRDTIVLLQEEIARLEAELRARDESPHADPADTAPDGPGRDALAESQGRVAGLLAELAGRDETVEILLEQSRLYEEAAAAQRAEWDQLNGWVEEVERRVDGRDAEAPRLRAELEAERDRAETLRRAGESDRRTWEAQRAGLEREAQLFRNQIAGQRRGAEDREGATLVELAAENRRLHTACEASGKTAAEAGELGRRLAAALSELDQARRDLRHLEDERQRERIEHEAEAVALRSRLAGEAILREPGPAAAAEPERPSAMDPDERIRAFRQHLKELHENEAARRADRSIASRLSRIWRHTGPG